MALAALALAGSAQATAIHYNFENVGANPAATDNQAHDSLSFTRGGVTVTVTAQLHAGNTLSTWQDVNAANWQPGTGVWHGHNGLGVKVGPTDGTNIDGSNTAAMLGTTDFDEGIVFSFSRVVRLTRVNFGDWDGRDNYIGSFDIHRGDQVGIDVDGVNPAHWARQATDTPTLSLVGQVFRFTAFDDNTSFRIQDLDIQVIPEPAPLTLLAAALGVLLAGRRREGIGALLAGRHPAKAGSGAR
jgi:hypothetical protein